VRRALLGFAFLMCVVMLGAWLLYASIDPDEASAAGFAPATASAPPR
jgi:hypothetical protein